MAGKTVIKPYKLKPSGEVLSRDDLSTWRQILLGHIRQNNQWLQFLPNSVTHKTWECTDDDENNGLVGEDNATTNTLRSDFQDFLTCVATYAPAGFSETIMRESTSFNWVIDLIKSTYGLETKGEHFLALDDLKFEFDTNFTYQQAYMTVKDFICASLIKEGAMFEGKQATAKETLSPTTKNFITKEWLTKIDPRLPKHVKDTRGHLFTAERPSLSCNQKILCDQIPTMLAELDSKSDNLSQGHVNIGYVPAFRGGARGRSAPRNNFMVRAPFRPQFRPPGPPARFQQPMRGQFQSTGCYRCLEATPRRYDAAQTHQVKDCPWPAQQQQQARKSPNFRVVLFPEDNSMQQPQLATVAMGQQMQGSVYNQEDDYQYAQLTYYDQYYQPQEPLQSGATISEIQSQDL